MGLRSGGGGGVYSPIWAIRGCAAGQAEQGTNPRQGIWLQDYRRVFGNQKSDMSVCIYFCEQCFMSIKFSPKVHRCKHKILGFFSITSR